MSNTIDLDDYFTDPNNSTIPARNQTLTYSASTADNLHIDVLIGADNSVSFSGNTAGWVGNENVVFTATDPTGLSANSNTVTLTITGVPDNTSPSISITSPSPGASVSSIVSLSASSTDNVAVQSVQFQIDGVNVGSLITSSSSPNTFTTSWNTANTVNGTHTLKAISTDTSGNTASTTITISNSGGSGNASADSFVGESSGGVSFVSIASSTPLVSSTSSIPIITTDTIKSKISSVVAQVASLTKNSSASDIATVQAQIVSILNDIKSLQSSQSSLPTSNVIALGFHFVRPLALGMSDNEVKNLQSALKTDSSIYPEGKVTGYFGSATLKAIQRFQEKYGIASSGETGYGKVGPKTREKLNELYGNK